MSVGMTQQEILNEAGEPQLWGSVTLSSSADASGVYEMTFASGSQYPIDAATVDWGFELRDGTGRLTIVQFEDHRAKTVACARLRARPAR